MKILLIDDEKSFHKIVKILAKKFQFSIICVSTIEKAKNICCNDVDMAIIDYELPDGNGLQINSIIKQKFSNVKTALCTGYNDLLECESSKNFDFKLNKSEIVPFISKLVK